MKLKRILEEEIDEEILDKLPRWFRNLREAHGRTKKQG
jgi:hypothetical protein